MVAPQLGDVHLVFREEPPRDFHRHGRNVEVERGAGAAEMRPLRHGFEMVHRFARLDFDDPLEPVSAIDRRQHEVREHLPDAHLDAGRLLVADVDRHVMSSLELRLEKADDPVVLELLSNRTNEDRHK